MEEPPSYPHLAQSGAGVPMEALCGCLCSPCSCSCSFSPGSISHLMPGNLTQQSVDLHPNPDVSIHLFLAFRRSCLLPGSLFPSCKNEITGIKTPGASSSDCPSQAARVLSTPTCLGLHLTCFTALVIFCFIGSGLLVRCRSECKARYSGMCLSSQHWGC